MITYEIIKNNMDISTYITKADEKFTRQRIYRAQLCPCDPGGKYG